MRQTTQTAPVLTMAGSGYVREFHADAPCHIDEVVASLTNAMLGEVMKSLRAALSLHK